MVITIQNLLTPKLTLLIVLAFSLILLVTILIIVNKRLKKQVITKEKYIEKEETLREEIESLKLTEKHSKELLNALNILTKKFLKETFKIKKNLDYSELVSFFNEKKRYEVASLCQQMLELLYAEEEPEKEKVEKLIRDLEFIFNIEHPAILEIKPQTKEEKSAEIMATEAERIAKELAAIDSEQIIDAYNELQIKFEQAYESALKESNKENVQRLEKFKKAIMKRVEDYKTDKFKIIELAEEISRGAKMLNLLTMAKD